MIRNFRHCPIAGLLLLPGVLASAQSARDPGRAEPSMPGITIRVFDYARVPATIAKPARQQTSRIFRNAGVAIEWVLCPVQDEPMLPDGTVRTTGAPQCQAPPQATDIQLNILSRPMARKMRKHPSEFGVAFPLPGGFGNRASIFYHRVDELAERQGASRALLLGHFIAHEIGHLLLGVNSHSNAGLMRVPWDKTQRDKAYQGTLLFTPQEASRLRRQVAARQQAAQAAADHHVDAR